MVLKMPQKWFGEKKFKIANKKNKLINLTNIKNSILTWNNLFMHMRYCVDQTCLYDISLEF